MVKSYPYGIASDDNEEGKTLHTLTYVIDDALNPTVGLAFKVLTYVLLQSPAAPLKKALLDAGVGKDVSGDFQDGILQPVWSVSVNGSEKEAQEKIIPVVQNVLTDMIKTGIDKTLLIGALNRTEFTLREADFAGRPKGLIYGIRCMLLNREIKSWNATRVREAQNCVLGFGYNIPDVYRYIFYNLIGCGIIC